MHILIPYLRQYWQLSLLVLILATINQIFSLLDAYYIRRIIDEYATKYSNFTFENFMQGVLILLIFSIGAALVSRIAKNFQDYYLNKISKSIGAKIYRKGVRHVLNLPFIIFEDTKSGETLSILQAVRNDVVKFLTQFVNILFFSFVGFIVVIIYAFTVHWTIAAGYILSVPIIGSVSFLISKQIKEMQKNILDQTNELAGSTTESLRNIEIVKILGLQEQEMQRLNSFTKKILGLELLKLKKVRTLNFIQGSIINIIRISLIGYMMYLIFMQEINFGEFFSLFIYSFYIFNPLQEIGTAVNSYREAEASLEKYERLMEIETEPKSAFPKQLSHLETISFTNVEYQYPSGSQKALEAISFEIKAGETIAFVGPSGSGKTTLVKILVGLYTPSSGNVSINTETFFDIDLADFRKQIGFVTQDTQLFAGTIKENLLFVNPDASDAQVLSALEKSACQSLLERAQEGIDTVIGEGGVKVSGGEKQRLAIARALLRNPKLLIFDEATSALDSLTEEAITSTMKSLSTSSNHMTVLIAHRLSTIMHADTIYVLEKGRIVESGDHESLLSQNGLYHAMWRQQIGERRSDEI